MFRRGVSPLGLAGLATLLVAGTFAGVQLVRDASPEPASLTGVLPGLASPSPTPSVAPPVVNPKPAGRAVPPASPAPKPAVRIAPPRADAVLRGLSAWIDVYDYSSSTPVATAAGLVDIAADRGATTVWIEPSRYKTADIWAPAQLGAMLDRAATRGLPVVLWTLPGFKDPAVDYRQGIAAANFRGPRGGKAAAVALDIEVSTNAPPALRTQRLVDLARKLRKALPVPLISITPNPVGMTRHPDYWPGFPWRELAAESIGIAPMGYWSFKGDDPARYTRAVIQGVQQLVGRSSYPVHPIGGLAEDTTPAGYRAFCAVAHETGAVGAGIYDLRTTASSGWTALDGCRSLGS